MSEEKLPYRDWRGYESGVKEAAKKLVKNGQAENVADVVQAAHFDRFLSRVFAEGQNEGWMLKGGSRMLARVPTARRTRDVDLATSRLSLQDAAKDLERAVSVDIGDHMTFKLKNSRPIRTSENQPGVQGVHLSFVGIAPNGKPFTQIPVDLVVGHETVGKPDLVDPLNKLDLPRSLPSNKYRLYPSVDQIAEKVSATLDTNYPGGISSTRVKDIVDLAIIAETHQVDYVQLRQALLSTLHHNKIPVTTNFDVPSGWDARYSEIVRETGAVAHLKTLGEALAVVRPMIEPAMQREPQFDAAQWQPGEGWQKQPTPEPETPEVPRITKSVKNYWPTPSASTAPEAMDKPPQDPITPPRQTGPGFDR